MESLSGFSRSNGIDIARRGWIGDYVDPNNFLDLFISGGGNNSTGYADTIYDDLILKKSTKASDRESRYKSFIVLKQCLCRQCLLFQYIHTQVSI